MFDFTSWPWVNVLIVALLVSLIFLLPGWALVAWTLSTPYLGAAKPGVQWWPWASTPTDGGKVVFRPTGNQSKPTSGSMSRPQGDDDTPTDGQSLSREKAGDDDGTSQILGDGPATAEFVVDTAKAFGKALAERRGGGGDVGKTGPDAPKTDLGSTDIDFGSGDFK